MKLEIASAVKFDKNWGGMSYNSNRGTPQVYDAIQPARTVKRFAIEPAIIYKKAKKYEIENAKKNK